MTLCMDCQKEIILQEETITMLDHMSEKAITLAGKKANFAQDVVRCELCASKASRNQFSKQYLSKKSIETFDIIILDAYLGV